MDSNIRRYDNKGGLERAIDILKSMKHMSISKEDVGCKGYTI